PLDRLFRFDVDGQDPAEAGVGRGCRNEDLVLTKVEVFRQELKRLARPNAGVQLQENEGIASQAGKSVLGDDGQQLTYHFFFNVAYLRLLAPFRQLADGRSLQYS